MMKSHPWDDQIDNARDFFDSIGLMQDADTEGEVDERRLQRRRLTELRRRAEERLDWKRTYGDLQFDDLDHFDEDRVFGQRYRFEDAGDPGELEEH